MVTDPIPIDAETLAYAGPVTRLFRAGLGRLPEPEALHSFADLMRNGTTNEGLARIIVGSPEFLSRHGPGDVCDAFFLEHLYHHALDREPDTDERRAMLGRPDRAALLAEVANSAEARRRVDLLGDLHPDGASPTDAFAYALWVRQYDTPDETALRAIGRQIGAMPDAPMISLVLAAGTSRVDLLLETIESLDAQLYGRWELCIALPQDMPRSGRTALAEAALRVPGLSLVDGPPRTATGLLWQAALDRATGDVVAFLDPGDRLAPTALYEIALALDRAPQIELLYTDEDSIDGGGGRFAPLFKPGWSPDMLLAGDTVGQLAVIRRARVRQVGGIRPDGGSHLRYDLLLRAAHGLAPDAIAHLPAVLCHRGRMPGRPLPFPQERATAMHPDMLKTARRHLAETGAAVVLQDAYLGGGVWPRVLFPLPAQTPRVSVVVTTRARPDGLGACVAGLLERTRADGLEVLVADSSGRSAEMRQTLRRLSRHPSVRIEAPDGSLHPAALLNRMAALATGDLLVLMEDTVDVLGPDWLDELLRQIARPGVGIVGPRLVDRDEHLRQGGLALDEAGPIRLLRSARAEEPGYMGQLALSRDVSAVSGACLAVRRDVFEAAQGFDEDYRATQHDVDLCLKVRAAGHRVVWTPHAVLTYADGRRDDDGAATASDRYDLRRLRHRWSTEMAADPFLNANLVATCGTLVLATPPRPGRAWAPDAETSERGQPGSWEPEAAA